MKRDGETRERTGEKEIETRRRECWEGSDAVNEKRGRERDKHYSESRKGEREDLR